MTYQTSNHTFKIRHAAIVRAPGLLPMLYTTRELSDELQIPKTDIIYWIKHGLPHTRDNRNHIWIHGRQCADWIEEIRRFKNRRRSLKEDEAYCLGCRKPIKVQNKHIRTGSGPTLLSGSCPECGSRVNKGVKTWSTEETIS